jgi:hypothetical protein
LDSRSESRTREPAEAQKPRFLMQRVTIVTIVTPVIQ